MKNNYICTMRTLIGIFALMTIVFIAPVSTAVADGPNTTKEQCSYVIGDVDNTSVSIEVAESEAYGQMISDCMCSEEFTYNVTESINMDNVNTLDYMHSIAEKNETYTYLNTEGPERLAWGNYYPKTLYASNVFDILSEHSGKSAYRC